MMTTLISTSSIVRPRARRRTIRFWINECGPPLAIGVLAMSGIVLTIDGVRVALAAVLR